MAVPEKDSVSRRQKITAWAHRHRAGVGSGGAAAAAGMTAVWLVVVPEKANQVAGLQEQAIRWGHPLCWALLSVAGVLYALGAPKRSLDLVCYAAAGFYAAFLTGMMF